MFDPVVIKKDFPIFTAHPELVYLDSAATSQKPEVVLKAMDEFQRTTNANPHRGVYDLAETATAAYENARKVVAEFFGAKAYQLVFTRNATEAINLVANSWGRMNLHKGDRILLTELEHHSNIVPWQLIAEQTGAVLEYIPVSNKGTLDLVAAQKLLANKPKILAVSQMSNVLGTLQPVKELILQAHAVGAKVLIDGAQGGAHLPTNFSDLDADFYAFSGHKMLAPFGIGGLLAKSDLLEAMPPYQGGGDMIREVFKDHATWNDVPHKFEAGTPNVLGAVGLAAAIDYLKNLGMENVWQHEHDMGLKTIERLQKIPGVTVLGPADDTRGGVVAFTLKNVHPHDVASLLNEKHIAVRAGNHCTQVLHDKFGIPATTRASFSVFNTDADIEQLAKGIEFVQETLG